jgi:uncharacterized membrane protein (DUF2068 family)
MPPAHEKHHHHHPAPKAVDEKTSAAGLRTIATFEALKGFFVLAVGLGLLHYLHRDLGGAAEHILARLNINPSHHSGSVILEAAYQVTDAKLWAMAGGAMAYSTVRFVEAYGLWHRRVWAEWFALLSGALYLPLEIFEVLEHATPFKWAVLVLNLLIVAYMGWIRWKAWRIEEPDLIIDL